MTAASDPLEVGQLITLLEAASRFGLNADTLRRYAQRGRLRSRKRGRDWMTTDAAVREYLDGRDVAKIPQRYRRG